MPTRTLPLRATLAVALTAAACGSPDEALRSTVAGAGGVARDGVAAAGDVWRPGPTLPQPLSNNAVAAVVVDGRTSVFTFAGIDSTKAWSGVTNVAYRWDVGSDAWEPIEPVPGPGRLAATAQAVDGRIFVLGGYTVAEDGSEKSLPDVAIYDPVEHRWSRGTDIPVPTDDAVSGVWRDRSIVLVSGWHDDGNVADVQIYDASTDAWTSAPPVVGAPVFGHVGAVVGDVVVYAGGAAVVDDRPRFRIDSTAWVGTLSDDDDLGRAWRPLGGRPGPPLYRAAGGTLGGLAVFLGGTDNPYNYDGVGYDGVPAEPLHQLLFHDPGAGVWGRLEPPPEGTMDHRNLAVAGGKAVVVGGMTTGQRVSDRVWWADAGSLLATRRDGSP